VRLLIADKKKIIPINFWEKVYSQVSVQIASHDMKIKLNTADYKEIMIYVRLITRNNMVCKANNKEQYGFQSCTVQYGR
jgi:hypothetical protein